MMMRHPYRRCYVWDHREDSVAYVEMKYSNIALFISVAIRLYGIILA